MEVQMKTVTPIFRMFNVEKAKEFYIEFLEFKVDWEHRYEPDLPLYMQVSCGECIIHLSEHYGDCCPGSAIRIAVDNIEYLHERLTTKQYKHARPGLDHDDKSLSITDPFGNRLHFFESQSSST